MLINGSSIPYLIRDYRVAWIRGRYGIGKTLFAYYLWWRYFRRWGYRLFCNFQAVGASSLDELRPVDEHGRLRAMLILDEGGDWLSSRRRVIYSARKRDYVVLVSGRARPPKEVQELTIVGRYSLMSSGLPLVRWVAIADAGGLKDEYPFWFAFPQACYGMYSTLDMTSDPSDLLDRLSLYASPKSVEREKVSNVVDAVVQAVEELAD
jgi:hypothetical protein